MTLEQAIYEITHKSSFEEKLYAIEQISKNLRSAHAPTIKKPRKTFELHPFNLGKIEPPTREEMYDERTKQILGIVE